MINFLITTSYDYSTRSVPATDDTGHNNVNINDDDEGLIEYAEIFKSMKLWHESDHPFVFLNQGSTGYANSENTSPDFLLSIRMITDDVFPGGISILSLNPHVTDEFMDDELKQTLVLNGYATKS